MLATLILAACSLAASGIPDQTIRDIPTPDGTTIRATITTPDGADLKKPYPVIIVFPPGQQNEQMERTARVMFYTECVKRGWVLVTPQPPGGVLFFQKDGLYKALIDDLDKTLVPEGGKYHVAGASNGGRSALNFALEFSSRTASVAGFPGAWMNPPPEAEAVQRLKGIPIRLWVGGDDSGAWLDATKGMEDFAKRSGGAIDVKATTIPGQGHFIRTLTAAAILSELETARKKEGTVSRDNLDVLATLDALHAAASRADFDGYFALYTPDAVFIGTDATERWTVDEFKAYARPHFQKGKVEGKMEGKSGGGWTYLPRAGKRHVTVDPSGTVAFFDELLDNENYGTTRGTGVVRKVTTGEGENAKSRWLVAQYSLSIPIPNPLAKRVAAMVKTEEKKK